MCVSAYKLIGVIGLFLKTSFKLFPHSFSIVIFSLSYEIKTVRES